jgi:hypothetical protein
MLHTDLRDVSLADRIEHTPAYREAGVDPVAVPAADQVIGIAAGEEQIPLLDGKDQLSSFRAIDLLQSKDVRVRPVRSSAWSASSSRRAASPGSNEANGPIFGGRSRGGGRSGRLSGKFRPWRARQRARTGWLQRFACPEPVDAW